MISIVLKQNISYLQDFRNHYIKLVYTISVYSDVPAQDAIEELERIKGDIEKLIRSLAKIEGRGRGGAV